MFVFQAEMIIQNITAIIFKKKYWVAKFKFIVNFLKL